MPAAPSDLERWNAAKEPVPYANHGRQVGGPFSEFDTLGRKQPRRLGLPDYLLTIAQSEPARVRRVPSSAITEEVEDEMSGDSSFVTCPCGAHPVATGELKKCAGCERHYVEFELGSVFVVYGAMTPPPLPSIAAD